MSADMNLYVESCLVRALWDCGAADGGLVKRGGGVQWQPGWYVVLLLASACFVWGRVFCSLQLVHGKLLRARTLIHGSTTDFANSGVQLWLLSLLLHHL